MLKGTISFKIWVRLLCVYIFVLYLCLYWFCRLDKLKMVNQQLSNFVKLVNSDFCLRLLQILPDDRSFPSTFLSSMAKMILNNLKGFELYGCFASGTPILAHLTSTKSGLPPLWVVFFSPISIHRVTEPYSGLPRYSESKGMTMRWIGYSKDFIIGTQELDCMLIEHVCVISVNAVQCSYKYSVFWCHILEYGVLF